jgi:predicted amidohydrolase
MLAGGRIPGYSEHTGKMSAKEYVDAVVAGRLKDPALNAHLKAGYTVKSVHYGYIEDQESLGYATHLVMLNPSFRQGKKFVSAQQISRTVRKCRVCAIQYEMQKISGWADFCEQVEYFIDTADAYDSHIVVFPELFIAQMLCTFPRDLTFLAMVRKLADLHADYVQFFTQMAKSRDLFIVAGSVPVLQEDGRIKNVAHLFSPAGQYFTQDKLHLTPAEKEHWGMSAGDGLAVFDTIYGRIGILICYDIEFPELSRILVNAGVDMIVVPFATDERKAYQRVRFCAQARSVENIIYTVLSGNVGTLPRSPAMGINFGQAAILTPSDFAFPLYSIAAEGVVNTQTVVVSDLDIGALEIEREIGNVRPLLDRRTDLYNLVSHVKVQRIRVM